MIKVLIFSFLFITLSLTTSEEQCKFSSTAYSQNVAQQEYSYTRNTSFLIVELENSTGARCLDGSNYKFFFSKGHSSGEDKFMFFFESGGFCGYDGLPIDLSCYKRCQESTTLCGTETWGDNNTIYTWKNPMGFFSVFEDENPQFWNWNKILVMYCDGTNYQGYLEDSVEVNGTELWFRGYNNTKSMFEYAKQNLGLFESSEVIVSGVSAGAQASFYWSIFMKDFLPNNIKLRGIADSGFFMDLYNNASECHLFRFLMKKIANYTNSVSLDLFKNCPYANEEEIWKCLIPQYLIPNITFPYFIANPIQDYEATATLYGVYCVQSGVETCSKAEKSSLEKIRQQFYRQVLKIKKIKKDWGFFARSCFDHGYFCSLSWYGTGMEAFNAELGEEGNFKEALSRWYNNGDIKEENLVSYIDLLDSPDNSKCIFVLDNST